MARLDMAWSAPEATRPVPGSGALDQSDGRYGWMISARLILCHFCSTGITSLTR